MSACDGGHETLAGRGAEQGRERFLWGVGETHRYAATVMKFGFGVYLAGKLHFQKSLPGRLWSARKHAVVSLGGVGFNFCAGIGNETTTITLP